MGRTNRSLHHSRDGVGAAPKNETEGGAAGKEVKRSNCPYLNSNRFRPANVVTLIGYEYPNPPRFPAGPSCASLLSNFMVAAGIGSNLSRARGQFYNSAPGRAAGSPVAAFCCKSLLCNLLGRHFAGRGVSLYRECRPPSLVSLGGRSSRGCPWTIGHCQTCLVFVNIWDYALRRPSGIGARV